jgi:hypothetical protein
MTPYELMLHIEAFTEMKQAQIEQEVTMVWLGEYYHRLKSLPPLKDVMKKIKNENKKMTTEEMLEMAKTLNAQFGGTVETAKSGE